MLSPALFHPYVRCVGASSRINQKLPHTAYDHRLIAILEGSGIIEIDGCRISSEKGDFFIITPGTPYRVEAGTGQMIVVINFDMTHAKCDISSPVISVLSDFFEEQKIIEKRDTSSFFEGNYFVAKKPYGETLSLCRTLLDAYKEKADEKDDLYITGLFTQLFYHITKNRDDRHKDGVANDIYRHITENYRLPITLDQLSELFHFHPTYINRLMQKNYGTSVRQLILKCRFERALYLLDNTDMTVKEVAIKAGFSNPAYFSEAFYKKFGFYPSVYRK
ncbi:MAG: helix-turn-helix domain-containing protein [Ruminococcaceae bacterium]|nr:helix-turn-helix domain-containing protein [Oscillospiraceae bacterium]